MGNKTGDFIEELRESLLQNYKNDLKESMGGSEFVPDYHLQKISLKRGRSYIDSPKLLKNKPAINPENYDDNCFQYALTVALNHENSEKNPWRISKIKPFHGQYNWKEIDFPSHSEDWKNFERNIRQLLLISYLYHTILKK